MEDKGFWGPLLMEGLFHIIVACIWVFIGFVIGAGYLA